MERVHKANLLVILACVLALSVTTIMSYGMSAKSIKGCGVLVATLVIVAVANFLKISDFAKALVIVLCPSYAVLIYSGLVNGNRIAFLANFITLSMAARYFDKKISSIMRFRLRRHVLYVCLLMLRLLMRHLLVQFQKFVYLQQVQCFYILGQNLGRKRQGRQKRHSARCRKIQRLPTGLLLI